jgi:hypothetical protein
MGTLSKRPLRDFGIDIKERIDDFRSNVGGRFDRLHDRIQVEHGPASAFVRKLDKLTNALPASTWLALSAVSLAGALTLKLLRKHHLSVFVGQLVPTFLILGLYHRHRAAHDHGLH